MKYRPSSPSKIGVPPSYPAARRSEASSKFHGVIVSDPYDWLGDADADDTRAWMKAQSTLTHHLLQAMSVRPALRIELDALPRHTPDRLPIRRGTSLFGFAPSTNGGAALVRKEGGFSEVVFDPTKQDDVRELRLDPHFTYISVNGRYAAMGLARAGSDQFRLRIFDIKERRLLPDRCSRTLHPVVAWLPDESGFFYNLTRLSPGDVSMRDGVYRHDLGSAQANDRLVFEHPRGEGDASLPMIVRAGRVLLVKTFEFASQKAALYSLDLTADAPFRCLAPFEGALNVIGEIGDELFVETTLGAPRGRVLVCDVSAPKPAWRQVVPECSEVLAMAHHSTWSPLATVVGHRLFATYLVDATHRVQVFEKDGRRVGEVQIPGLFAVLEIQALENELETAVTRFIEPWASYRINASTLNVIEPLAADDNPRGCEAAQMFCTSADGTRVPMFVVQPAGASRPLPTLLYGYGGWGQALTPSYRPDLAAWIALGGGYVVANVRGGGEYGEAWHTAGARLNRRKTFEDFCAVGQALIDQGVCSRGRLAVAGRSNGGLLVAASINLRPDLFSAAVIEIPLVDVVNLEKLPAGPAIAAELGDPTADRSTFDYLYGYSPLQNVRYDNRRPAILVVAAERDERVPPAGAYKYVAALQATTCAGQTVALRLIHGEGHSGWPWVVTRDVLVDELSFLWTFATQQGSSPLGARGKSDVAL